MSINGESSALLLLSLGVAVLQRGLQEHSAEYSIRLRRILVSAKDLQKSLENANISDESTICKTLNKNGSWEDTMEEATVVQKNIAAHLKFVKEHLDVPQRFWQNIQWTD
jgi:hypothetical protein